jgi:hypothetical protein
MVGPGTVRYAPTYILHGRPGAFDELWGYEYMIDPMDDIISRRAASLYYVNLAYSIPIYLHIDLRKDNVHALMFWWYASTCRHLGLGGKHPDPAVWTAHRQAMQTYLKLKPFYAQGSFYGLDETVHAHTLPQLRSCLLDCFNLENEPTRKQVTFTLRDVGLSPAQSVKIEGAPFSLADEKISIDLALPARSHLLLKLRAKTEAEGTRN